MGTPTVFPKLRAPGQEVATRTQDSVDIVLRPVAEALSQTPIMGRFPVWTPYDLAVGFANTGGLLAVAAYHVDCLGYVHSKGSLTHAAGCAANTVITALPSGLRPKETLRLTVPVTPGAQWLTIDGFGVIRTAFAIAAGQEIDLAFTPFLAEQ